VLNKHFFHDRIVNRGELRRGKREEQDRIR
jgi:hypothetical protein